MKIRTISVNRRKAFEVRTSKGTLPYPFAKTDPRPTGADPVARVWIDKELDSEAFTYALGSRQEGTVHVEQVLEYNKDPDYLRDRLVYRLTLEAQKRVGASSLPKQEIIRRLVTPVLSAHRSDELHEVRRSTGVLAAGARLRRRSRCARAERVTARLRLRSRAPRGPLSLVPRSDGRAL